MPVHQTVLFAAFSLAFSCGCASTGFLSFSNKDKPVAGPKNPVVQALCLWQPAEGTGIDGKTCRGFAGQIFFFTNRGFVPAKVDGDVRVYLFDDQGSPDERVKPIHQFDFPRESWNALLHDGRLGQTYTIFIPYTRKGFHEANCSLRLRYTPHGGTAPAIFSEMVNVTLPGSKRKTAEEEPGDEPLFENVLQEHARPPVAGNKVLEDRPHTSAGSAGADERLSRAKSALVHAAHEMRPASVPLTPEERERIVREARARLGDGVETLSYESDDRSETARPSRRAASHPLDESRSAGRNARRHVLEDESDSRGLLAERELPSVRGDQRVRAHRAHPLDDVEETKAVSAGSSRYTRHRPKEATSDALESDAPERADAQPLERSGRRKLQTYTIHTDAPGNLD
jgi:hypothetical protein